MTKVLLRDNKAQVCANAPDNQTQTEGETVSQNLQTSQDPYDQIEPDVGEIL